MISAGARVGKGSWIARVASGEGARSDRERDVPRVTVPRLRDRRCVPLHSGVVIGRTIGIAKERGAGQVPRDGDAIATTSRSREYDGGPRRLDATVIEEGVKLENHSRWA